MLMLSVIVLGLAALGGIALVALRLRGGNPPLGFASVHGVAAAVGLILLAIEASEAGFEGRIAVALLVLVLAALGGFVLLSFHLRGKLLPLALVLGHGLIALSGYAVLLLHYSETRPG